MSYEKFVKVSKFISSFEGCTSIMNRDVSQLTTGNLSHHKTALKAQIKYLNEIYDDIKPLMLEYKEYLGERKE